MGLFNLFNKNSQFISEKNYMKLISKQQKMNAITISQLRKYGVTNESELKLEYFFYTDSQDKANNLAIELNKLNYQINPPGKSAGDKNLWLVNGWTIKMKMDLETLNSWVKQMCTLGYKNDCEFDGWGTLPEQK